MKATNLYDPEEDDEPEIEVVEEDEGSELYELLTAEDAMTMPPVSYLIDGLIPKNSLAMIYGTPGAGKSFLALDMALCISHGRSWRSKETKKGGVIYLASEGFGGMGQRLRAWYAHNQISDHCDLRFMRTAIDFIEPENIEKLIRTIANVEFNVSMIVVDTVARSFSGEENSAKEMGGFVRACGALMSATGATVLGVHHAGKAIDRGLRGSNALQGASDAILSVKKDDVGIIEVKTDKQKDAAEEPMPMKFVLEEVAISGGSSAVLVEVDSDIERDRRKKLTPREQIAFDALNNLLIDSNKNEIAVNAWHKEHVKKAPDATASNRSKARDALQLKGYIAIDNGVVWVRR